ncbi:MAG: hypothetical protein K2X32_09000 [Phycisphaerales bacterium]|nr:hypothetical protein [Phycisphaerales bacterium]
MTIHTPRSLVLSLALAAFPLAFAHAQPSPSPEAPPDAPAHEPGPMGNEPDDALPGNGPDRGPPGGGRRLGRDGQGPGPRAMATDPRTFRDALKTILDHMRESTPRLQKAVDDLDAGRSMEDVRSELMAHRSENNASLMDALRRVGFGIGYGGGPGRRGGPEMDDGPGAGGNERPEPGVGPGGPGGPGGGGPGGGGRGDRPGPGRVLNAEDRARIMQDIEKHSPEVARQIKAMREKSAESADRVIDMLAERMRGMRELEQRDPETFQLRQREIRGLFDVLRLRREYADAVRAKADEAALTALKSQLREAVGSQFDVKAELDNRQIVELEKRLERLRQDKASKTSKREAMVSEQTNTIIRNSVNPPRPPGGPGGPGGEGPGGPRPPR